MIFQIESHNFTVIAADSIDVKPFRADKLHLTAGERFDLVVEADQKERGYFWIRLSAGAPCATGNIKEFAVLMYHQRGAENEERLKMMNIKEENPNDDRFLSTVVSQNKI